jgi:hypothetical protein
MDDTNEILNRLDRIGALAEAGAGRCELLREVRGLLEEGERTFRAPPEPGRREPGLVPDCRRSAKGGISATVDGWRGEAAMS